mgnify:CR=1 FL=1
MWFLFYAVIIWIEEMVKPTHDWRRSTNKCRVTLNKQYITGVHPGGRVSELPETLFSSKIVILVKNLNFGQKLTW